MRTPRQVAEPVDQPQAALVATCANCGGRITRFNTAAWTGVGTMPGRWRHDNGAATCAPPVVEDAPPGDPGIARATGWFANGGRDDPPFDHLVKGDSA